MTSTTEAHANERPEEVCKSGEVAAAEQSSRRIIAALVILFGVVLCTGACGRVSHTGSADATTSSEPKSSVPPPSIPPSAPDTSFAQDETFFTDVTEADPALVTYEQAHGNVALRALLTDGSAFCALVRRGGGIDEALVAEADGARSTESQTDLPLSVTTFNTIEAVALLTLCPSEQKLLPASDRSRIRDLGDTLAKRSG